MVLCGVGDFFDKYLKTTQTWDYLILALVDDLGSGFTNTTLLG